MGDGSISRVVNQLPLSTASSKGLENNRDTESGKKLPAESSSDVSVSSTSKTDKVAGIEEKEKAESKEPVKEDLETAVASMNDYIQTVERDLHFSVDEELDQTIVKVIDSGSGDLVRQIPEETFLEIARKVREHGEFQLVNATG